MQELIILNYHRITCPNDFIDPKFQSFTLDVTDFKSHLLMIRSLGIPVYDWRNPLQNTDGLQVALTFDDGHDSDREIVLPLLESYGWNACFFPVTAMLNAENKLDRKDICELIRSGHVIGSHTVTHRPLSQLNQQELKDELFRSKDELEQLTGTGINYLSLPYGLSNQQVVQMAMQAGYRKLFGTRFGFENIRLGASVLRRWNIRRNVSSNFLRAVLSKKSTTLLPLYFRSESSQLLKRLQFYNE